MTPCPICVAPGGFHEEESHGGPLSPEYAHLARRPHSEHRAERPKGKPSDEEIARRRAAKVLALTGGGR